MTDLKTCPFCGGKAKLEEYTLIGNDYRYFIFCTECANRTQIQYNKMDTIACWNKRIYDE